MPYRWEKTDPETVTLRLWPFRSLTPEGHVRFVGVTAALLAVPLLAVFGSPALWGLLPFVLAALWALMAALTRNSRHQGEISEVLVLGADHAELRRHDPGRADRRWQAHPYWMRVRLRDDGPVEDYLTLSGGLGEDSAREVELGAFLPPEERIRLAAELRDVLGQFRRPEGGRT